MKQKRFCDECGNICEEFHCPICGRKTKVYHGKKETSIIQEKTTVNHVDTSIDKEEKKNIPLPKIQYPNISKFTINKDNLLKILGVIISIALIVGPSLFSLLEEESYEDSEVVPYEEEPKKSDINRTIVTEDIPLQCELDKEEYDENTQKVTLTNTSSYMVDVGLGNGGTASVFFTLPAHAEFEELVYEENLQTCEAYSDLVYEMSENPPTQDYVLKREMGDYYSYTYTLTLEDSINKEQIEQFMRYLYAQLYYKYESFITLNVNIQQEHQFDVEFDFYEGTIVFTNKDVENLPEDIYI